VIPKRLISLITSHPYRESKKQTLLCNGCFQQLANLAQKNKAKGFVFLIKAGTCFLISK
jgi:hypothetical protein